MIQVKYSNIFSNDSLKNLPTHLSCKPNVGEFIHEMGDEKYKKKYRIASVSHCQYNEDRLPIPYLLLNIQLIN